LEPPWPLVFGATSWVRIYCEKRCSKSSFSDATAVGRTPSAAAELAGEGKMLLRTAPLLLRLLRLLLLLLLLCAGVQAQLSRNTRMVQGGQCGEAALLCAPNVPNCDIDLLTNYALQMISGLELGTCEEVGYTVAVGSTTSGDCPGTRCVDVLLYAPTGAEICGSSEIAPLTDACAAFQSVDDDAICGSPCEAEARSLMGSVSCFVPGEVHMMLDTVTASCAGYVPVGESYACNRGLYFEAYYSSSDQPLEFGCG
jgi:hypothetical protein